MLVLFDIDGTLLLSRGVGMECFLQAGAEVFAQEFRREGLYFGGGLDPLIWRSLCTLNGISDSLAREHHDRFRALYGRQLKARLDAGSLARALPGVPQLLAALGATSGAPLTVGLLTGNYPETGALKLRAAGLPPEQFAVASWGCDGEHRRDLLPVALERCAASTGRRVSARDVVIVGDTPHDVDVAAAHGCRSLAVATGAHPVEELAACGATRAVADLSDTPDILRWLGVSNALPGVMGAVLHELLVAALAVGCAFWLAMIVVVVRLVRGVPVLERLRCAAPARWPALSVIVPARDEASDLAEATRSRLASDYPDLQLVLVDDRSRDATPAIVDALAAQDPRVLGLHVTELPDGWLGKVHAMQRGAEAARGEWLLFTDADVHLSPGALRRAIACAEERGVDHLVALPQIWSSGLLLDAVIACFGRLFALGTRPWAVSNPRSSAAVGVGAFNLVRRSAWERIGGFTRLRLAVADDVLLGVLLKRSGARQLAVNGRGDVLLHWYRSVGAMLTGLEKGLYGYGGRCRPWPLFAAGLLFLLLDAAPFLAVLLPTAGAPGAAGTAAVLSVPPWLAWLGGAALLGGAIASIVGARWMRARLLPLLLLPAGAVLMFVMFVRAGWLGWRRGGVLWRGTFHSSAQLRAALAELERGAAASPRA